MTPDQVPAADVEQLINATDHYIGGAGLPEDIARGVLADILSRHMTGLSGLAPALLYAGTDGANTVLDRGRPVLDPRERALCIGLLEYSLAELRRGEAR